MTLAESPEPLRTDAPLTPEVARRDLDRDARIRLRAAVVSLVVGGSLLAAKFWAWHLTGSAAVLSDALESIVNVLAAGFAIGGLVFAGRPADRNHPYGHGKIEFFSAAFEGGLIAIAAALIVVEAVQAYLHAEPLRSLDQGLVIVLGAGLVNALLGLFLVRTGRRYRSLTLVADGQHVLSDFWTSIGVVIGLLLVRVTGIKMLDPLVAGLVGLRLAWTGIQLVRHAAGGLLDEEDAEIVQQLVRSIERHTVPGLIRVHSLRALRAGRFHHVDAHVVVPSYWTVARAHDLADAIEFNVMREAGLEGEIAVHIDPCQPEYCRLCSVADCPIRTDSFRERPALTVEEAVQPDPPRDPNQLPPLWS